MALLEVAYCLHSVDPNHYWDLGLHGSHIFSSSVLLNNSDLEFC